MSLEEDLEYVRRTLGPEPYNHSQLQHAVQYVCGRMPGVVLWRNHTGSGKVGGRYQRWGLAVGGSDIVGIVAPRGTVLAMEIKTGSGRPSPKQRAFIQLVRKHGGVAGVVRSIQDGIDLVQEARGR